jgi:hypothetical protein
MEEELAPQTRESLSRSVSSEPGVENYWVVFLQPTPEAGERVAVALAFRDERGRTWIEFDGSFSRALALYPDLDPDAARFYLDSLQRDLNSSDDIERTVNSYGPQISASTVRRIASPIGRQVIEMLLAKSVYPSKARALPLVPDAEGCARER